MGRNSTEDRDPLNAEDQAEIDDYLARLETPHLQEAHSWLRKRRMPASMPIALDPGITSPFSPAPNVTPIATNRDENAGK